MQLFMQFMQCTNNTSNKRTNTSEHTTSNCKFIRQSNDQAQFSLDQTNPSTNLQSSGIVGIVIVIAAALVACLHDVVSVVESSVQFTVLLRLMLRQFIRILRRNMERVIECLSTAG